MFGPFSSDFDQFDYYPNCLGDSDVEQEAPRTETPNTAPVLIQIPQTNMVASIFFENTQEMKAFVRENKAVLKEWMIILPVQFIGRVRYDARAKPCSGYLVHQSLVKIPPN